MEKIVALLPIKAESERVPGKNFKELCGKPLYQWTLETLLTSKYISQVVIDTDSISFIKELNELYPSVMTILRPENIRGGLVPMNKVIEHDIRMLEKEKYFIQTHTTNPLLKTKTLDSAICTFFETMMEHDSLFSVNRIQARTYWKNGQPINHVLNELKRTQDLDPVYEENSNLFIFSRDSFNETGSRIGKTPYLFETSKAESLEIDEEDDFEFVRLVLSAMLERTNDENKD